MMINNKMNKPSMFEWHYVEKFLIKSKKYSSPTKNKMLKMVPKCTCMLCSMENIETSLMHSTFKVRFKCG